MVKNLQMLTKDALHRYLALKMTLFLPIDNLDI